MTNKPHWKASPGEVIDCDNCLRRGPAAQDRRFAWTCETCAQRQKHIKKALRTGQKDMGKLA